MQKDLPSFILLFEKNRKMSNQSYSTESESFFSDDTVVPGKQLIDNLKNELKNELESYKREMTRKVRFLQVELSDAKIEIADLKTKNDDLEKRVEELENKAETQDLKIDHLEKTIDEKIIENEMQRMTIETRERAIQVSEPPRSAQSKNRKPALEMIAQKNFGLSDDELEFLSEYGCLGHFLDNDKWINGKKKMDETGFALLLKAIDHGMKEFTLKMRPGELKPGNSKLVYSGEGKILKDGNYTTILQLSLTHEGRKMRFKARCQVMDFNEGYERKSFGFIETDSNGLFNHSFLRSEIPGKGLIFVRFHVTLIN